MQNCNNQKQFIVPGTIENKRPNILRKKTNKDGGSQSLLIQSGVPNTNQSYLYPTEFSSPTLGSNLRHDILNPNQHKAKRRTSHKIILDTYICDKNRALKADLGKLNDSNDTSLECFSIQDPVTSEVTSVDTIQEADVNNEPILIENPTLDFQQNNNQNAFSTTHSFLVDANMEYEDVLDALRQNGLPEGQLLLLSGNQGEPKQMWLCPLDLCNTLFDDRVVLDRHILSHFDLETFTCNKCNKTYLNEDKLNLHNQECHTENPSNPPQSVTDNWEEIKQQARNLVTEALASIGVSEDMMQSVVLGDGTRCWPCFQTDCILAFKTLYQLKNHILAHHDLRPFKCNHPDCGWAFRSLGKLRVHSEIHSGIRRHVCSEPGCCKAFSSKSNLNLHITKVHGDGAGGLQCPASDCVYYFPDKPQLKDHINTSHADKKCEVCGKRFWQISRLVAHSRSHVHTPAELVCAWPDCGRVFSQPSRLRYHQRSHTGDKPYRCTFPSCFWAFSSASKLRRHARAHDGTNGRKYSCNICGRAFLRSEHLREHQLRHLPNRQYKCDISGCEETFANKSTVYVHKKKSHNVATAEGEKKADNSNLPVAVEEIQEIPFIEEEIVCEEMQSLRSARTHVPWPGCQQRIIQDSDVTNEVDHTIVPDNCHILQHHTGIEEKQSNPLVCGRLELEGGEEMVGGSTVGAELCLGDVSQQGVDLNINSLLMQEELSEGMLYTTEDDSALHILLLNEEPPPQNL